jgi:hypothetical protein
MIHDYSLFLDPDYVRDFERRWQEDFEIYGDIIAVDDVYDGEDLIERIYKRFIDTSYGIKIDGFRASEDNTLNRLLMEETAAGLVLKSVEKKGELVVKTYAIEEDDE